MPLFAASGHKPSRNTAKELALSPLAAALASRSTRPSTTRRHIIVALNWTHYIVRGTIGDAGAPVNPSALGRGDSKMRSVVVTGTSTGIGWGTAKVLIAQGFRVFGSVRKVADAERLVAEFGSGFVPMIF